MAYHHLALACKDMQAIHNFYEGIMGFELVKVEIGPVPEGGWAKHFFYRMDNDSEFIAFWELHDVPGIEGFETNLSKAAGLPDHINHIAFNVNDVPALQARKKKWLDAGLDVIEINHNWCHSVYTKDPNDTVVEFCVSTDTFTAEDRTAALQALSADKPVFSTPPSSVDFHSA